MAMSATQKGYLRRTNVTKPTISDHRSGEIEYVPNTMPWVSHDIGPGVQIVNVKADDGQVIEDGEYLFVIKGDGRFAQDRKFILSKQGTQWTSR